MFRSGERHARVPLLLLAALVALGLALFVRVHRSRADVAAPDAPPAAARAR